MSGRGRPRIGRGYTVDDLRRAAGVGSVSVGAETPMGATRPGAGRTLMRVEKAALVGVNWPERRISKSIYMMDSKFCKDLTYFLNTRLAVLVGGAKAGDEGWTSLVNWPGRGVFLAVVKEEIEV